MKETMEARETKAVERELNRLIEVTLEMECELNTAVRSANE